MMSHRSAVWLNKAVSKDGVTKIMVRAIEALKGVKFDTIAFRGISGALIAPILAHKLKKEIALVRHPRAHTHSDYKYEGYLKIKRYIIVDDLVCTGKTATEIIRAVRREIPDAKFVGIYLYYQNNGLERPGLHTPDMTSGLIERIKIRMNGESL